MIWRSTNAPVFPSRTFSGNLSHPVRTCWSLLIPGPPPREVQATGVGRSEPHPRTQTGSKALAYLQLVWPGQNDVGVAGEGSRPKGHPPALHAPSCPEESVPIVLYHHIFSDPFLNVVSIEFVSQIDKLTPGPRTSTLLFAAILTLPTHVSISPSPPTDDRGRPRGSRPMQSDAAFALFNTQQREQFYSTLDEFRCDHRRRHE